MRKITRQIAEAFRVESPLSVGNTTTDGTTVYLHGNAIVRRLKDGKVQATLAGWGTPTTRERINGVLSVLGCDVYFSQKNHDQYINYGNEFCQDIKDLAAWYTV